MRARRVIDRRRKSPPPPPQQQPPPPPPPPTVSAGGWERGQKEGKEIVTISIPAQGTMDARSKSRRNATGARPWPRWYSRGRRPHKRRLRLRGNQTVHARQVFSGDKTGPQPQALTVEPLVIPSSRPIAIPSVLRACLGLICPSVWRVASALVTSSAERMALPDSAAPRQPGFSHARGARPCRAGGRVWTAGGRFEFPSPRRRPCAPGHPWFLAAYPLPCCLHRIVGFAGSDEPMP